MTGEFSLKSPIPHATPLAAIDGSGLGNKWQQELEALHQQIAILKQEKYDLEVLLENTIEHSDAVETLLHESNRQLRAEILERKGVERELKRSRAELQRLLDRVSRDKQDLEIILETITEHGDFIEEQTHQESIHDSLTGLYNRQYLEHCLEREIHRAQRQKGVLAVVMIDIDYFKVFNDTFGHDAGDRVLQCVGKCLQDQVRDIGIACRYGGEELTLVLPHYPPAQAQSVAEQTRQAIKNLEVCHRGKLLAPITISAGVACYPEQGQTLLEVLKRADLALYQAKNEGRDRVAIAT